MKNPMAQLATTILIVLFGTMLCIGLANGQIVKGELIGGFVLLMVLLGLVITLVWLVYKALRSQPLEREQAIVSASVVVVFLFIVFLATMGVGRDWLRPALNVLRDGGVWWPFVAIITGAAAFFAPKLMSTAKTTFLPVPTDTRRAMHTTQFAKSGTLLVRQRTDNTQSRRTDLMAQ